MIMHCLVGVPASSVATCEKNDCKFSIVNQVASMTNIFNVV